MCLLISSTCYALLHLFTVVTRQTKSLLLHQWMEKTDVYTTENTSLTPASQTAQHYWLSDVKSPAKMDVQII